MHDDAAADAPGRAPCARRAPALDRDLGGLDASIVLGGLAALVLTAPGWPAVRDDVLLLALLQGVASGSVLGGFWLDVRMFLIVEVDRAARSGC